MGNIRFICENLLFGNLYINDVIIFFLLLLLFLIVNDNFEVVIFS